MKKIDIEFILIRILNLLKKIEKYLISIQWYVWVVTGVTYEIL